MVFNPTDGSTEVSFLKLIKGYHCGIEKLPRIERWPLLRGIYNIFLSEIVIREVAFGEGWPLIEGSLSV